MNLTAILISFLRPEYTTKCVQSLAAQYPGIKILVAENGHPNDELKRLVESLGGQYHQLPFDSGVCVARNYLAQRVQTDYVLVGDDDFYYTPEAAVDAMLAFLERHPEFDLIGGRVKEAGIVKDYQGYIELGNDYLILRPLGVSGFSTDDYIGIRYKPCDITFNYFVARAETLKQIQWDEKIKVRHEHSDWFIALKKAGKKVAFTPDAIVEHKPPISRPVTQDYRHYRYRTSDRQYFAEKHNFTYSIGFAGRKTRYRIKPKNDIENVDFLITTFLRPDSLRRLVESIARYYPGAHVYIADQNKINSAAFYRILKKIKKNLTVHKLPYDSGLSKCRNYLVKNTPGAYKLILDDDFIFNEHTKIEKFIKLLQIPGVGAVGGLVKQSGQDVHYEYLLAKQGDTIFFEPDGDRWSEHQGIRYKPTGCILNFALYRQEVFDSVLWDDDLKVSEHMEYMWRLNQTNWKVLYTPEVWVDHLFDRNPQYVEMRNRQEFKIKVYEKLNIAKIAYRHNGMVTELRDGVLVRYRQTKW